VPQRSPTRKALLAPTHSHLPAMSDADRSHSDPDERRGFSFFGRGRGRDPKPQEGQGAKPGQLIGDFRLVRSLDQGGMGQVWEAQQLSLERLVALKLVRPDRLSDKTLALFSREARAGGRLHHPNLVSVFAHGEDGGIAWIAMELIEGGWTLRDFLDEAAKEPQVPAGYYQDAARFMAAVADGMQAAHAAGVIHRDLKPQNILIDPEDRPKVTDFGLAKLIDESALSVSGEVAGTYWYMSPEQVAAKRIGLDHRTDVFSLGVVLYELLSHRRPFEGDTSRQVAEQIVTYDPPELRTVRSRIPRDLAVITAKCLEKARDRRYSTMAELAADLRRYLNNQPILAKPPSRLVKVGLWMRRNPTKSVAGGVAVVAFGIISVLLAENVRARAELTQSNSSLEKQTRVAQEEAARAERAADAERSAKQAAQEQAERAERAAEAERLAAAAAERSAAAEKRRADEVLRLSAIQDYEDLLADAGKLWPPYPDQIPAYERWLSEAQALVDELPEHRRKRDELRALALPQTDEEREADRRSHPEFPRLAELEAALAAARETAAPPAAGAEPETDKAKKARAAAEEQLPKLETELAALTERLAERRDWRFPPEEENARWWNGNLTKLIEALEGLEDPKTGLLSSAADAVSEEHGWSVARRLEFAQSIADRSVTGPDAQRLWSEAIAAIGASPKYDGLTLTPQMGLIPIGPDPDSGFWEFAHLATGEAPVRDDAGRIVRTESMGVGTGADPRGDVLDGSAEDRPRRPELRPGRPSERIAGARSDAVGALPVEVRDDAGSVAAAGGPESGLLQAE
jgi:serine/threonine protein kinase